MNNKKLREKTIALLTNPEEEDSAALEKAFALLKQNYTKPLVLTGKQQKCFDRAIKSGLIEPLPDGTYRWLSTKVLLSYFCGRVFCGDSTRTDTTGARYWEQGTGHFPATALERLFDTTALKQLRHGRLWCLSPKKHELVDEILQPCGRKLSFTPKK